MIPLIGKTTPHHHNHHHLQQLHYHHLGRYLHADHPEKIFVLSSLEDTGATFQHKPLFGDVFELKEGLDALKAWKPTKKENQSLCDLTLCAQRLPHHYDIVLKEMDKMEVNALLVNAYKENVPKDDAMLGFTQHPSNLVLLKKAKKKEIKLFPLGQCSVVADQDLQQVLEKGKQVLVYYKSKAYAVQPFKALTNFVKAESGTLCPYFFVRIAEEESQANMAMTWVDHKGLKIPVLENKDALNKETLLFKDAGEQAKGPPKKKAKRA